MSATTPSRQFATATLNIGGMTCSSCSNNIQDGLKELPTVKSCIVSVLTNSGTVVFDPTLSSSITEIVQVVKDMGYDCTLQKVEPMDEMEKGHTSTEVKRRTIQLVIEGMYCDLCPSRITESLDNHFGDRIQFMRPLGVDDPILSISYQPEPSTLTIRSIVFYIQSVHESFVVRPHRPPSTEDESRIIQRREQREILWRLALSAVIAIPTLLIGVIWMSLVKESDKVRKWFEMPLWTRNTPREQWALFFLATPVYFVSASSFHTKAAKEIYSLWRKRSNVPILRRFYRFGSMNLLISAGTTVAYFASLIQLVLAATSDQVINSSTYFDSVVFLTFFILIGRFLEAVSKAKAGDAVSMLGQLRPETALLTVPADELKTVNSASTVVSAQANEAPVHVQEISADLLEIGDNVVVPRGSTPPADGVLFSSEGQFDESSLTGESKAVRKVTNDRVYLGTINTGNPVRMVITDIAGSSMLDQIIAVVREGQTRGAPVERIADSITAYFVPIITLLACLTFFLWLGLGESGSLDPKYINNHAGGWAFWSLEFAIAVFVVACPCGIGLAAPTALYVGTGLAAKAGILVRGGGEAFQEASHLDAIVFDKTGTLTEGGTLQVTDCEMLNNNNLDIEETILWNVTRNLEENSSHPIAKAIATESSKHPAIDLTASEITEIPGQGMRGIFTIQTTTTNQPRTFEAILGSEALIKSHDSTILDNNTFINQTLSSWKSGCKSIALLAIRKINTNVTTTDAPWTITTLFSLSDPIRSSAAPTIAALQEQGIKTYMLSGDNPETARAVAMTVGIPVANVFAGALPQQKAARIEQLKRELAPVVKRQKPRWWRLKKPTQDIKQKEATIAFVGDGINDAPALLASSVSISLSTGSPIALTSSSFILLTPSLESIVTLLALSRKVFRRIQWNFGWALMYNVILIPVAAGVLFRVRNEGFILGPVWASAAMALSSVSVVLASLAMRWGF